MRPENWDKEADVVVVGFGAAGVATAVTAFELGAEVLILEKAPKGREGGNTKVCLLYTSPSPRDRTRSRMPSSA